MFLNQVRVLSGGFGLLAVYALEKRERQSPVLKNTEITGNNSTHTIPTQSKFPEWRFESLSRSGLALCQGQENIDPVRNLEDLSDVEATSIYGQGDARVKLKESIDRCSKQCNSLIWQKFLESGLPGLVVAVSVNGKLVWSHGYGYADLENKVMATPSTVMRIASISKSMTMAVVAKLYQEGRLDLDKPVRDYVPNWPEKHGGITVRHLVSHLSGVRHYTKKKNGDKEKEENEKKENGNRNNKENKDKKATNNNGGGDTQFPEFFLNRKFESVTEALELFKNDELLSNPGEEYHYTTHGFTLLSAVVESIVGEPFEKHMRRRFKELGLERTTLDENEPIINNRARFYTRTKDHKLVNTVAVDNSYKWAGGGFLSTVADLVKFGNAMLYSYQAATASEKPNDLQTSLETPKSSIVNSKDLGKLKDVKVAQVTKPPKEMPHRTVNFNIGHGKKPYLNAETMKTIWSPVVKTTLPESLQQEFYYGMGWVIVPPSDEFAFCKNQRFFVSHTGGAVGASSILLILPPGPEPDHHFKEGFQTSGSVGPHRLPGGPPAEGVVVAMMCNLDSVGLTQLALEVAKIFENVKFTNNTFAANNVEIC